MKSPYVLCVGFKNGAAFREKGVGTPEWKFLFPFLLSSSPMTVSKTVLRNGDNQFESH